MDLIAIRTFRNRRLGLITINQKFSADESLAAELIRHRLVQVVEGHPALKAPANKAVKKAPESKVDPSPLAGGAAPASCASPPAQASPEATVIKRKRTRKPKKVDTSSSSTPPSAGC